MIKLADISLLNSCNFTCNYCISKSTPSRCNNSHKSFDVNSPILDADSLYDYIESNLSDWYIQLSGGEPLTYPGIFSLTTRICSINKTIINTNGDLLLTKKKLFALPSERLFFRISMHPEQRTLVKFKETMDFVKSSTPNYTINYMIHPKHIEESTYLKYIEFMEENEYKYEITPFLGDYNEVKYESFSEIYNPFTDKEDHNEHAEFCTIRPNGLVFKCHGENDPVGDVYNNTFSNGCSKNCDILGTSICNMYDSIIRISETF